MTSCAFFFFLLSSWARRGGPSGGTFNISSCQDNLITLYRSLFEYEMRSRANLQKREKIDSSIITSKGPHERG